MGKGDLKIWFVVDLRWGKEWDWWLDIKEFGFNRGYEWLECL